MSFCSKKKKSQTLLITKTKVFDKLKIKKIFESGFSGRICLPCSSGIICDELMNRTGSELMLKLFDYSGKMIKEKRIKSGDGPDEIRILGFDTTWVSASGKIYCIDNDYLKSIDINGFKIETLFKFSNMIDGYGTKYLFSFYGGSSLEEKDDQIVTSFESTGFYENLNYYIVLFNGLFKNLKIISASRKPRPPSWIEREKQQTTTGQRVDFMDIYEQLRLKRMLSVDWKRNMIYFIVDIEKPEIESIDFQGNRKSKYSIPMDTSTFNLDRKEIDEWVNYLQGETEEYLRRINRPVYYVPSHSPAIMGIKVIKDWLLIISGKRDWEKQQNEVLVFNLPTLSYDGSFYIPFPNLLATKWVGDYYVTKKLVENNGEYSFSHEVYSIIEK